MADISLLKKCMENEGVSANDLADKIGIDRATLYRKLAKEGSTFSIAEANRIKEALSLSSKQATRIFFAR